MNKFSSIFAATAIFAGVTLGTPVLANVINGSLTGVPTSNGVPSGWATLSNSPDTNDLTHNVGQTSNPFVAAPSGPSPDGGTWVGLARNINYAGFPTYVESFGQTLTGLSIGTTYDISWYAGNFGVMSGSWNQPNSIEVLIDSLSIGSGALLPIGSDWYSQSLSFAATTTNHALAFRLVYDGPSYLSIDGIALAEMRSVPEPTTLALLTVGLFGLGFGRRKRA